MSLLTRVLGLGLALLAGFMVGWVQGLQSIPDYLARVVYASQGNNPVSQVITAYFYAVINPNYGSFWEFGIVMAIVGFLFVARGDKKMIEEQLPDLQPLIGKHDPDQK